MSNVSEKNRSRSSGAKFFGIPLWMSLAVLCGGLLVGSLISLASGKLGLPFVLCFIISVVFSVLLTEPRSLFLSVVSIPIFFSIAAGTTGWFLNQQISRPSGSGGISKTQILSAIYPLLQQFPVMAIATIGAGIIAYLRWHLVTRYVQQLEKKAAEDRRRDAENKKRVTQQVNQVRATAQNPAKPTNETGQTSGPAHPPSTGSITVAELIKRNQRVTKKGQRRQPEPTKPASAKSAPAPSTAPSPEGQPTPKKSRRTPASPKGPQQSRTTGQTSNTTNQAATPRRNPRQPSSRQAPPQRQTQQAQQPQRSVTPQPQRQNPPQRPTGKHTTSQQRPTRGGQQSPQSGTRTARPGNNLTARQGNPRQQQHSQPPNQPSGGRHSSGQLPRQQPSRTQRNQQATPQASRQQPSRQQPNSRSTHTGNQPAGTSRSSTTGGTHSAASQSGTGRRTPRQVGHQAERQPAQQPQKRTQRTGQPAQRRTTANPNQPASRHGTTTGNGSRSGRQDRQPTPRQDHRDPQNSTSSNPPKPRVRRRRALNDDLYS